MADSFDPYHKWLGIPPEEQPPNHYRLLAISPFENDQDVIAAAADGRMAFLRTLQTGKRAELTQRLLNEVAAAHACLARPEKKAAYDQRLRFELDTGPEGDLPSTQQLVDEEAEKSPAATQDWSPPHPIIVPKISTTTNAVAPARADRRQQMPNWLPLALAGGAASLLALVAIGALVWKGIQVLSADGDHVTASAPQTDNTSDTPDTTTDVSPRTLGAPTRRTDPIKKQTAIPNEQLIRPAAAVEAGSVAGTGSPGDGPQAGKHVVLGIQQDALTQQLADQLGIEKDQGVVVSLVYPATSAAAGGLKKGDVILSFSGRTVRSSQHLDEMVRKCSVGSEHVLEILENPDYATAKRFLRNAYWGRAQTYQRLQQHAEAIGDYTRAIEQVPNDYLSYLERGGVHATIDLWDKAAADFGKAAGLNPKSYAAWRGRAMVALQAGDMAEYRRVCREMVDQLGDTEDIRTANGVAWTCALAPEALTDMQLCVQLAKRVLAEQPERSYYQNTLGAVLYRAGDWQAANVALQKSIELHGEGGIVCDYLFLAMTHCRLDHPDEARDWLAKAVKKIDQYRSLASEGGVPDRLMPWQTRVEQEKLLNEAESLISGNPK
jgi:tetratricopeptide (TPR) repeat protein